MHTSLKNLPFSAGWIILAFDFTTAFFHAQMGPSQGPIAVWPAEGCCLTRALFGDWVYGLRTATRGWQDDVAHMFVEMDFIGCKPDATVCAHV